MSDRWRPVALVALGAVAAIAGRQVLGVGSGDDADPLAGLGGDEVAELSRLAEQRAQAAQELALAQFYRLQEFRQFGSEGQGLVFVVPVADEAGADPLAAAASGGSIRLPRLVLDPGARQLWDDALARLGALEASVDPRVFSAFESVRSFAADHPWPDGAGLAAAGRSDWTRPEVIESWLTLNRALVSRIDGLLAGF